jgi:hypothetical protein
MPVSPPVIKTTELLLMFNPLDSLRSYEQSMVDRVTPVAVQRPKTSSTTGVVQAVRRLPWR